MTKSAGSVSQAQNLLQGHLLHWGVKLFQLSPHYRILKCIIVRAFMVCCGINSICPIHAFLLSRSVQATGEEAAELCSQALSLKDINYSTQLNQSSALPAPSIHPLFFHVPCSLSPDAASSGDLHLSFHLPSLSLFPSDLVIDGGGPWSSFDIVPQKRVSRQTITRSTCTGRDANTHKCKHKTGARQKQQRLLHRFNGKTSHSVLVRQH